MRNGQLIRVPLFLSMLAAWLYDDSVSHTLLFIHYLFMVARHNSIIDRQILIDFQIIFFYYLDWVKSVRAVDLISPSLALLSLSFSQTH